MAVRLFIVFFIAALDLLFLRSFGFGFGGRGPSVGRSPPETHLVKYRLMGVSPHLLLSCSLSVWEGRGCTCVQMGKRASAQA